MARATTSSTVSTPSSPGCASVIATSNNNMPKSRTMRSFRGRRMAQRTGTDSFVEPFPAGPSQATVTCRVDLQHKGVLAFRPVAGLALQRDDHVLRLLGGDRFHFRRRTRVGHHACHHHTEQETEQTPNHGVPSFVLGYDSAPLVGRAQCRPPLPSLFLGPC